MKYTFAARQQPKSERGVQKSVCERNKLIVAILWHFRVERDADGRLRLCCAAAVAAEKSSQ